MSKPKKSTEISVTENNKTKETIESKEEVVQNNEFVQESPKKDKIKKDFVETVNEENKENLKKVGEVVLVTVDGLIFRDVTGNNIRIYDYSCKEKYKKGDKYLY